MDKNEYQYCIRCGRKLKTPEAKERGMGKVCAEKYKDRQEKNKLFEVRLCKE